LVVREYIPEYSPPIRCGALGSEVVLRVFARRVELDRDLPLHGNIFLGRHNADIPLIQTLQAIPVVRLEIAESE
jgi:hypothetical protein